MLSYEGIFFESDVIELIHSLETERLAIVNDEIHCTFKYHPTEEEIFDDIVGKSFEVSLIGYGNDGNNSGFLISLPDELIPYYINFDDQNPDILNPPHITASLSEVAKATDTRNLDFKLFEKPIRITGRFGYWIKDEDNEYLTFDPFFKSKIK